MPVPGERRVEASFVSALAETCAVEQSRMSWEQVESDTALFSSLNRVVICGCRKLDGHSAVCYQLRNFRLSTIRGLQCRWSP